MKSYEEMTRSVLDRAQLQRQQNKRRTAIGLTAAITCTLCLALLTVFAPGKAAPNAPAQLLQQPRATIMLLGSPEDTRPKELIRDVVEPYHYLIRVQEADLPTLEEQKAFMAKERAYAEKLWAQGVTNHMLTCYRGKTSVITLVSSGRLMLKVDDYGLIKGYKVTTTGTGYISDQGHIYAGENQGLSFGWTLTEEAVNQIEADPAVKLSTYSDTITIQVEFVDGTVETVVADVVIQDDGLVFIVHRGATVSA